MKRSRLNILPAIFSLLMLVTATGCRDAQVTHTLARAEAVMEEHPDSARRLLDGIDPARLHRADIPLYAVLDAQSRHKLYLPAPSDSLLDIAVDRYTSHGPDSLLMKALFYRAVGYRERGDISEATKNALYSWELATSMHKSYWQAKDAELIADLANTTTNYREELKWRHTAYERYKDAGRLANSLFSLCDMSEAYLNLHDTVQARRLDDSLSVITSEHPEISGLREYRMFNSLFLNTACGSLETADSLYNLIAVSGGGYSEIPSFKIVRTYILMHRGKYAECRHLLDSLSATITNRNENPMLFNAYIMLASETGDMGLMTRYTDSMLTVQQRIISDALAQPVTSIQRDYLRTVADTQKAARHRSDMLTLGILVISLVSIAVGIWVYRRHSKRKQREIEEKILKIMEVSEQLERESHRNIFFQKEIDTLRKEEEALRSQRDNMRDERNRIRDEHELIKNEICELRSQRDDLRTERDRISEEREKMIHDLSLEQKENTDKSILIDSQQVELKRIGKDVSKLNSRLSAARNEISGLYIRQWQTVNMLCREFFSDKNTEKASSEVIVANIDRELEKMKSAKFFNQLENDLNKYSDNIIVKLRAQCPMLKDEEIRFCILMFAGLSSAAVALLTGLTMRRYYSKKQNITDRILRHNPADRDLFMAMLK